MWRISIPATIVALEIGGFTLIAMPNANSAFGWGMVIAGGIILFVTIVYYAWRAHRSKRGKLTISGAEIYEVGDGSHWLRLKVENPTALPIQNCYGKLLDRKQVTGPLMKVDSELVRLPLSSQASRKSREHGGLPPEGHRFPWFSEDRSLTTVTISGNQGFEFLYLVTKRKTVGCFWFPTNTGNGYENWSLGDFELELEIGSDSETFKPRRVHVVFRADGGYLELVN